MLSILGDLGSGRWQFADLPSGRSMVIAQKQTAAWLATDRAQFDDVIHLIGWQESPSMPLMSALAASFSAARLMFVRTWSRGRIGKGWFGWVLS